MARSAPIVLCVVAMGCAPEGAADGDGADAGAVGEACDLVAACAEGLTCARGECVECRTNRAVPGKICLADPVVVAQPGAASLHLARLSDGSAIFLQSSGDVDFRFLRPDFQGGFSVTTFEGEVERGRTHLVDLDGDSDDEVFFCHRNASHCDVGRFESGSAPQFDRVIGSSLLAPMPPNGTLPARIFYFNQGEFSWRWHYPTGDVAGGTLPFGPRDQALVGDLDGDGIEELVFVTTDEQLVVLQPTDDGFGFDVAAMTELDRLRDATIVELDGTPGREVLLPMSRTELRVIDFDGTTVEISDPISSPYAFFAPAVGDLDADGRPDIVMASNGLAADDTSEAEVDRIVVLLQTEPGVFETKVLFPPVHPTAFAIANLDEDPELELLGADSEAVYRFDNDL